MKSHLFRKKQDTFDYNLHRTCKVCSNAFQGRYCNVCGEKVIEPYERSFLTFLYDSLNAFTFFDGKFMRTLKLLLARPGQLSRNIADGVRVPYMKMISLFFLANFLYYLFPVWDTFNSSLYTQMNALGNHSIRAEAIVQNHIAAQKLTLQEFEPIYRATSTNLSKLLIVLLVLMLSGVLAIVNFSRSTYFFDHLLFSMEYYSFHLLINLVVLANGCLVAIKGARYFGFDWGFLLSEQVFSAIALCNICYFLFRGQMVFYGQKWYWSVLRTVLIYFLMFYYVYFYRAGLFYFTMWFV